MLVRRREAVPGLMSTSAMAAARRLTDCKCFQRDVDAAAVSLLRLCRLSSLRAGLFVTARVNPSRPRLN